MRSSSSSSTTVFSSFKARPRQVPRVLLLLSSLSVLLLWFMTAVEAWTTTTTRTTTFPLHQRPSLSFGVAFVEKRRLFTTRILSSTSMNSQDIVTSSTGGVSSSLPPQQRKQRPSPQVTVVKTTAATIPPATTSSTKQQQQQHAAAVAAAAALVDWDWKPVAASAFANGETRPILLYDGICNFCNNAVNTCLDLDTATSSTSGSSGTGTLRYASLHSKVGQALLIRSGKSPWNHDSIVLVTYDTAYFHSNAVLRVTQQLQGIPAPIRTLSSIIRSTVPMWLRDATLKFVSERRYLLGGAENDGPSCRLDLDGEYNGRFLD